MTSVPSNWIWFHFDLKLFAGDKKEVVLLLFKGDYVEELRTNLEKILFLLQFPIQVDGVTVKIAADLKLSSMLVGLNGNQCRHCCIYCEVNFFPFV